MNTTFISGIVASAVTFAISLSASAQQPSHPAPPQNAHFTNTFSFDIAAPIAKVAPLFGPEAERKWAGADWDPVFAHPQPGRDVQGAVFTVKRGPINSV